MTHAQAAVLARKDTVTSRLINSAPYVCVQKLSYREYVHLVRIQIADGFGLGNRNHGRKAWKEMILSA